MHFDKPRDFRAPPHGVLPQRYTAHSPAGIIKVPHMADKLPGLFLLHRAQPFWKTVSFSLSLPL